MSLLELHPKHRPIAASSVLLLCLVPALWHGYRWQSANDERKAVTEASESALNQKSEQAERDERIALERATRCIVVDDRYPFTDGSRFYYDPAKRQGRRILPSGTSLCNATSGHTAILDDAGTVTSIKQAPVEKIQQILKQRGLI